MQGTPIKAWQKTDLGTANTVLFNRRIIPHPSSLSGERSKALKYSISGQGKKGEKTKSNPASEASRENLGYLAEKLSQNKHQ